MPTESNLHQLRRGRSPKDVTLKDNTLTINSYTVPIVKDGKVTWSTFLKEKTRDKFSKWMGILG